jgi:hypothetical protein
MSHKRLSLQDFKTWLDGQKDLSEFFNLGLDKEDPNDKFIGNAVRSKVSEEKLLERIETDNANDTEQLVREFVEEGGTVLGIEGKKIQIEVDSGNFSVPRFCVKIERSE